MELLAKIFNLTKDIAGFELFYFPSEVQIDVCKYVPPISLWGITANKNGSVWLLNGNNEWFELEPTDRGFEAVATTITIHLKKLSKQITE